MSLNSLIFVTKYELYSQLGSIITLEYEKTSNPIELIMNRLYWDGPLFGFGELIISP